MNKTKLMPFKIMLGDNEVEAFIKENDFEKVVNVIKSNEKKTGYERVGKGHTYSFVNTYGEIKTLDDKGSDDDLCYEEANYYSDITVAENNARADKLMRQLRRFAVEHREHNLCWIKGFCNAKWSIVYDCPNNRVIPTKNWDRREAFAVYFHSESCAEAAIDLLYDELIWYFTEYKDSL
jgi:hypothetical protein